MDIETEITDREIFMEEDLPESTSQSDLVRYLIAVLEAFFWQQGWFISDNLAVVYARRKYLAPNIGVFKGVVLTSEERVNQKSYRINPPRRPPPSVVIEITSQDTWEIEPDERDWLWSEKLDSWLGRIYLIYAFMTGTAICV